MPTTRLRDKSQMTVPVEVTRQLGLRPEELLDVRVVGDAFVVCPQRAVRLGLNHPMQFWGQGRTAASVGAADVDAQLRALRDEWER